jgi:hypothetical protein
VSARAAALAPLFLVSAASLGFEIALTRYFAVAKWSEYGYWVISIVLAGFALSGVVLALARDWFARHGPAWLAGLPAALIVAGAAGYHLATTNPFNPLQLQNPATVAPQLADIAGYYAALLPFFGLAGLFVSLSFMLNPDRLGQVYGADLLGAGAGAGLVLALMVLVHPFRLTAALLPLFALAAAFAPHRRVALPAALAVLMAAEALLLLDDRAAFNDFKAIYAPLHTEGSRVLAERRSPRGLYQLLDDFTERVDTDVSNDAGMLGIPGPPTTFGLYRDGNRIAALPRPPGAKADYAPATLAALPYALRPRPRAMLIGASGGFRVAEARALGASDITALEPEPALHAALRHGLGPVPPAAAPVSGASPLASVRAAGEGYDIIDIAGDFLDAAEANASAFSVEALAADLRALRPGGILSIPVSIREFPAYALRMLATARAALLAAGIADPAAHVLVYRSAWNARILLSRAPFDPARIAAAKTFADQRSFDISFAPGLDATAHSNIYNDLPAVSFEAGEVASEGEAHDAIADEAGLVLAGQPAPSARSFNLAPITLDRPAYYALLRLDRLGTLLRRLELLPQAEVGALVNLAVLAQAAVIAAIVLLLPLAARRRLRVRPGAALRAAVYFGTLGLGFLAIEIVLIERASFLINDRTSGFALVLTAMLVFSGLGSMASGRFSATPWRGVLLAAGAVVAWCALMLPALQPLLLAAVGWPLWARGCVVLALTAPVAFALGMPFPLGLAQVAEGPMLPWAWALNGAFSVVATPLANLLAREQGFRGVLLLALVLYALALMSFPGQRKTLPWLNAFPR